MTAVGACTCLGDAIAGAAAARAGLRRSQELDDFFVIDPATNDGVPLVGHPARGVTDGFQGRGRLLRLGVLGLRDLMRAAPWLEPAKTPLFLALPRPVIASEEPDFDEDGEPIRLPLPESPDAFAAAIAADMVAEAFEEAVPSSATFLGGQRSALLALRAALAALRQRDCEAAMVGVCDSMLDEVRLSEALAAGRLKHAENPVGYMPGEASAFLLLERQRIAETRAAIPALLVSEPLFDTEPNNFEAGLHPLGRVLARIVAATLGRLAPPEGSAGTVFTDLNGEPFRSGEWGHAGVLLRGAELLVGWPEQVPALSFGDTGAAAPLLAMVLGWRAFARGHAKGDIALVVSSDDDGARGAVTLHVDAST